MKKALMLAMVVLALVWVPVAMAEVYVGAYGGATLVSESDIEGTGPLSGAKFRGVDFDAGPSFGAKIGTWTQDFPYMAFEANLWTSLVSISGAADLVISGINYGAVDLDADVTLINGSASLLLQYPTKTFRPYGGIGLLVSYADVDDISVGGFATTGEDTTSLGFLGQAGLEYKLTERVGLFGEYRYTWANYGFEFEEFDGSTHNFLIGAAFHF